MLVEALFLPGCIGCLSCGGVCRWCLCCRRSSQYSGPQRCHGETPVDARQDSPVSSFFSLHLGEWVGRWNTVCVSVFWSEWGPDWVSECQCERQCFSHQGGSARVCVPGFLSDFMMELSRVFLKECVPEILRECIPEILRSWDPEHGSQWVLSWVSPWMSSFVSAEWMNDVEYICFMCCQVTNMHVKQVDLLGSTSEYQSPCHLITMRIRL